MLSHHIPAHLLIENTFEFCSSNAKVYLVSDECIPLFFYLRQREAAKWMKIERVILNI